MGKMVVVLGAVIIIVFLVIHAVYDKQSIFPKNFTYPILIIAIAIISSTFGAYIWHDQSPIHTLTAQYDLYFFLFYFLLHLLKPDPKRLLNMFMVLGFVYCGMYILQFLVFTKMSIQFVSPDMNFLEDRGTVRIFIPGSGYLFTAYFLALSNFFIYKKAKYLLYTIPIIVVVLLLGTRQVTASIVLLTLVNIILSRTIKSKAITFILISLCIIPVFYLFQGIFIEMFEITMEQSENIDDNIRIRASTYFLFNYNKDFWWMLIGNGFPSPDSAYGQEIHSLSSSSFFWLEDIGLIGDFMKFGIIFVIGQLFFLFKLIFSKTQEKHRFILYNSLSIGMTMFTGGGLHAHTITLICMMMYIADVDKHLLNKIKQKEKIKPIFQPE